MRKQVVTAIPLLFTLLFLSYLYSSTILSSERGKSAFHIDKEVKHADPHPTQCSMWSAQPPPARVPRWVKQYDPSCSKYAYVPFNVLGGFGHKTDNFMHGLIFSSALNLTYIMAGDFERAKRHSSLSGVVDKFGLGAYSPSLDSVRFWKKKVHYNNDKFNYEDIVINQAKNVGKCDKIYKVTEFFTDDRSPVRWHMAHMVQSRLASTRETNTAYNSKVFNIAIHLRYGSSSPYKKLDNFLEVFNSNSSNTVRMIKLFTEELETIGVPYVIHFFTAGKVDELFLNAFPGAVVHGKEMSVVDTIQHFIESDLLFCFVSSMCRAASIMSTRPLVVNGYPTAEAFFYNPCPRGLFCSLLDREAEDDLSLKRKVREAGERWLVSHKLNCPVGTPYWLAEDTSIAVNGPEQCDIWGQPLPPRMLFDPVPDVSCPRYGYIPLNEGRSGSLANVLRWVKGVALSSLLNVTFVFAGNPSKLKEEVDLGFADGLLNLYSLNSTSVDVPLNGVKTFSEALEKLEDVRRKCGTAYKFEDPGIDELGWTHLTIGRAVQKHIIDTKWEPTLWTMEALNFVVDLTGQDETMDMEWVFQSLDTIFDVSNREENGPTQVVVIVNKDSEISSDMKGRFNSYGKVKFVTKPKSVAEHVKHLVAAADIVFCPNLAAEECHIAAIAGSRPGFIIRVGEVDDFNFCPGAGMCSLVLGDRPVTEANVAFVRGISERWNVGRFTKCL